MKNTLPVVMTVAGSDSGGGAGIQADLKTFSALGVYGVTVVTSVTAQNSQGVHGIYNVPAKGVIHQIKVLLEDFPVEGVKTGMLPNAQIIKSVAETLANRGIDIVVDPVIASMHGNSLMQQEAVNTLKKDLFPLAKIITPNIQEAEILSETKIENEGSLKQAAKKLISFGSEYVLITGGHHWDEKRSDDYLFNGNNVTVFNSERIRTDNTHGSGCTFSSAVAGYLAFGNSVADAVSLSKKFVRKAINNGLYLGKGTGTLNQFGV